MADGTTCPALGVGTASGLCPPVKRIAGRSSSRCIVVMGVSGTGKSTLGAALAARLALPFVDGDDLHPASNVAKMARGEPLTDGDRAPWLRAIRETAIARVARQDRDRMSMEVVGNGGGSTVDADACDGGGVHVRVGGRPGVIIACSALKKAYRAVLRGESDASPLETCFVHLEGDRDVLTARMLGRAGHFMKAGMLESQLDALESPEGEPGVVTVAVETSTEAQVQTVVDYLSRA